MYSRLLCKYIDENVIKMITKESVCFSTSPFQYITELKVGDGENSEITTVNNNKSKTITRIY